MTYDAIIIGARIGGATTALLLAQKGYSVLLLDQDRFPSSVISTHLFFTDTMDVFERIGVLDDVLRIDATRLARLRFPYVDAPFAEQSGRDFALCIRRDVLDTILVEHAMKQPNIEVRTQTRVVGLERDGERVTGVRFRPVGETQEATAKARIVIGADGRNSRVAREAGDERYHEVPAMFAWYYGYFRDVPLDEPPSARAVRTTFPDIGADYAASFIFPADDQLTLIGFGVQHDAFDRFRENHRENFLAGLRLIPEVIERLGDAEPEGPIVGTGDLPNFFRVPHGQGWALVGDAGSHKDPHTVQGMGDAARSAVLLVEALDAWWRGDEEEASALARYQAERDANILPMYDFTTGRLEQQFSEEEWKAYGALTWEDPDLARARVAAMAHAIPPSEVYSASAIRAVLTKAAPPVD